MTGSKLKTNRSTVTKAKNIGSPIVIQNCRLDLTDGKYSLLQKFLSSTSAEDQLGILKHILDEFKDGNDKTVAMFLAVVFYEAPAKHPIRCFVVRHITKCPTFHKCFASALNTYIVSEIRDYCFYYDDINFYKRHVSKIMLSTENFPPGAKAIEDLDVNFLVEKLFVNYFVVKDYRRRYMASPSPTEKNEQFGLEHTMLRLFVHILQDVSINESNKLQYQKSFIHITNRAEKLIFDREVPMDTKSLAGILVLHIESLVSRWPVASIILSGMCEYPGTRALLDREAGRLVLLCALAAAAPLSAFNPPYYTDQPTMLVLVERILPYADGSAGSGDVTLCVARALLALASRALTECTTPASLAEPNELVTEIAESGAVSVAESVDASVLTERLLGFVWPHLEHPLDAVRHLARELLARCLQHAARGEAREKETMMMDMSTPKKETSLEALLSSVRALGPCRSAYWAAAAACDVLGAPRVLRGLAAPPDLLRAAAQPHLQAAASAAIAAVLGGGACAGLGPDAVYATWVRGALGSPAALQAVLPPTVEACPQLPAYISGAVSGRALLQCARVAPACRAPLAHRTLRAHAIQQDDESRLLVVSLLCERDRGTEVASREDLAALLWALHYNLASPRPAFRTALLHYVNKLVKRLADSSLAAQKRGRGSQCAHYRRFMQHAWRLAAAGAGQACAPARRATALHLFATLAPHLKAGEWAAEDVDTLLAALDDSYDGNKELALAALAHCPADLLERCSPLALRDVVAGARGARAARGAAAAARLRVLLDLLPHTLPAPRVSATVLDSMGVEERAYYSAGQQLLAALKAAEGGNLREEAARGGTHGTLRCLRALLDWAAHRRASWNAHWGSFHLDLLDNAINACARAEPAVCSQAPEGFLPPLWPGEFEKEQEQVTAQTVLVCAWRTIKEGAAVISLLAPFVATCVCGADAGPYLVALLSRARHRGAVEQAAEGLQALAHHCWETVDRTYFPRKWLDELLGVVCAGAPHATRRGAGLPAAIQALVSSEVTATGRTDCFEYCMKKLLQIATNGNQNGSSAACSDAPTTHSVSDTAVMDGDSTADLPADVARRTLAANILRALFRHSALERASQPFVADGLKLALNGFGAAAWPERTAMSLLFCALSVRVFGVSRARGALHARNTLPAHVLAARYPGVLDAMLSKLVACGGGVWSGPAVLPVLLVLARIYPTHATPHSLQICRFVPLVQQCACASDLRVRRLAASALPALLLQDQQLPYIEKLLAAVSKPNLHRNHWHGALLTLSSLIARANCSDGPIGANDSESANDKERENTPQKCIETLKGCNTGISVVLESLCALTQATGERACYVIAREYCGVLNLLVWKYPGMVGAAAAEKAMLCLDTIVFNGTTDFGADKELCRADCLLLHLVLLQRLGRVSEIIPLIVRALAHTTYEVYQAACDFLLIQLNKLEDAEPCLIRQHLTTIRNVSIIPALRSSEQYQTYLSTLTRITNDTKQYQECRFKSLRLLTLEDDTQQRIIRGELPTDTVWLWEVFELMREINEDNVTKYMYLESLLQYIKGNMELLEYYQAIHVLQLVYDCSSSQNTRDCRLAIISYLESDLNDVIGQTWEKRPPQTMFFYKALLYSTLVTLLEDDDDDIRQRASDVTLKLACLESQHGCDVITDYKDASLEDLYDVTSLPLLEQALRDNGWRDVTAAASGAVLRARLRTERDGCALLLLLALLDFRAEVYLTDARDESRVFDQSERYNVLLEESVWTTTCADIFIQMNTDEANLIQHALTIIHDKKYSDGFRSLCRDNLKLFEKLAKGEMVVKDECLNPKIEVLIKILSR